MKIRFYLDSEAGEPHVGRHAVGEEEVRDVMARPLEDRPGHDGTRVALGQTAAGRYPQVVYVPYPGGASAFVVTAYDPTPNAKRAYRKRQRRNQK